MVNACVGCWAGEGAAGRRSLDGPGLGATLIVGDARALWEALANPVGLDVWESGRACPLKFRRLEGSEIRRHASVASGDSAR
jgi:hypothetical protein